MEYKKMNEPPSSPTRSTTSPAAAAAVYQPPASAPPASYPTAIMYTEEQSGWLPTRNNNSPQRHTLKDRIKRNMLANSLPPSFNFSPTTINNNNNNNNNNMTRLSSSSSYNNLSSEGAIATTSHNATDGIHRGDESSRRSSVLDAASALASLGVALPKVARNSSSSSPSHNLLSHTTPLSTNGSGMDCIVGRDVNQIDENICGGEGRGHDRSTSRRLYELYHQAPPVTVTQGATTRHYTLHNEGMGKGQGEDVGLCGIRPPPSLLSTSTYHSPHHQFASKRTTVGMAQDVGRPYNDANANNNQTSSLLGSSSTDISLTFPQKLMEVLSNPEVSDIITWLPHGKGFIILQKRRFSMDVMPLYFKHSKFTSFTRKLNRWGFTRVSRGPEMGAYYHKFFQRGNYILCMQMRCQSTNKSSSSPTSVSYKKGGTSKKTKNKEEEVDGGSKSSPITTKIAPCKKKKKKPTAAGAVKLSSPKASITMVPTLELMDDDDEEMVNEEKDSTKAGGSDSPIMSPRIRMLLPPSGTSTFRQGASGTLARFGSQDQQHQGRHELQMQKEQTGNSGFDRAFSRQQAFLRTNNHQQVGHRSSQQQGREMNMYASTTMQSQRQNEPSPMSLSMSQMNQQRQLQLLASLRQSKASQQQQRLQSSTMRQQELSGQSSTHVSVEQRLHTDESRNHPQVIAKALKSRNDHAYLTALTTNEHTKADMAHQRGQLQRTEKNSIRSPPPGRSRVHAAMQSQLQRHQEYSQATRPTHNFSSQSPPTETSRVGGYSISTPRQGTPSMLDYTTLLSQMKQLEKSDQSSQGVVSSTTTASGGGMKVSSLISQLSQNEVAQLRLMHDSLRQQQSASGVSGAHNTDEHGKRKHPRSVRRASAA